MRWWDWPIAIAYLMWDGLCKAVTRIRRAAIGA